LQSQIGFQHEAVLDNGLAATWLANQMCSLVQIRAAPTATVVHLHKKL